MVRFEPINQSAHVGWAAASVFGVAAFNPALAVWALMAVVLVALILEAIDHFIIRVQSLAEAAIDVAFYVLGAGLAYLSLFLGHRLT